MSLIIGLTGGIASGKSTVSNILRNLNIPVIDADEESRLAVEKGEKAYYEIISYFGKDILLEDGTINRGKLGSIIFPNQEKRKALNSIVHPVVRAKMKQKQEQLIASGHKVVVLDIPLLIESNWIGSVDKVIVVYVDEQTQLDRLMRRNGFTIAEARSRINSQMSLKEKCKLADAVIDNNGSIEETKGQLITILSNWGLSLTF